MSSLSDHDSSGKFSPDIVREALQASLVIHSHDLFGDEGNLVMIRHGKDWYRLMKTKQGKLILTK